MTKGRLKGNAFENAVCLSLSLWLYPKLSPKTKVAHLPFRRRTTSITPIEGHWEGSGDILHRPDLPYSWPFCVECKNHEGWDLDGCVTNAKWPGWAWWQQAIDQTGAGSEPLLIFTRNRRPSYVMLKADTERWLQIEAQSGSVLRVERPGSDPVVVALLDDLTSISPTKLDSLSAALRKSSRSTRRSTKKRSRRSSTPR